MTRSGGRRGAGRAGGAILWRRLFDTVGTVVLYCSEYYRYHTENAVVVLGVFVQYFPLDTAYFFKCGRGAHAMLAPAAPFGPLSSTSLHGERRVSHCLHSGVLGRRLVRCSNDRSKTFLCGGNQSAAGAIDRFFFAILPTPCLLSFLRPPSRRSPRHSPLRPRLGLPRRARV